MLKFVNMSYEMMGKYYIPDSIVCYGAGKRFEDFYKTLLSYGIEDRVLCCLDQSPEKYNGMKSIDFHKIQVKTIEEFIQDSDCIKCIIITVAGDFQEIISKLDSSCLFDGMDCMLHQLIRVEEDNKAHNAYIDQKIPKRIHYCWFGGSPIPDKHKKYIESWEKQCPDYEIIKWDESNYDISKNQYMYEAYKEKKWGFVPDYARLDIVYQNGGIYMDTDVELIRPLDDLLYNGMFCGYADMHTIGMGAPFGAVKGHTMIKKLRDYYDDLSFYNEDGSLNLVSSPYYQTLCFEKEGLQDKGKTQMIGDIKVCSKSYFSPCMNITSNREWQINPYTYAIHDYAFSWGTDLQRLKQKKDRDFIDKLLNERMEL